jgi:hypothetical protein
MTDDSAEVTYLMWNEENVCNVSVLQKVHLSNIVTKSYDQYYVSE